MRVRRPLRAQVARGRRNRRCLVLAAALLGCGDDSPATSSSNATTASNATSTSSATATATSTATGGGNLEAILARLRADRDGTMVAEGNAGGFPAPVDGGCLVVATEPDVDAVAGDHDAWEGTPLQAEAGFAWGLVPCTPGARYKLVTAGAFVADPWARAYAYDDFGEISLVVPPPATAHRERFLRVASAGVAARTVRVWVPAAPPTHVVFAADGQNLFEPGAPFGGWRLDESAPAGMLIVGIDNDGAARFDEYTHVTDDIGGGPIGGDADTYAAFVHEVVEPMTFARYGAVEKRGLLGSSLGGLVSLIIADRYPGHYRMAMSLSGTAGWGSIGLDNETIIARLVAAGHQATALYVDSGGGGDCFDADGDGTEDDDPDASDNYCENAQLRDALSSIGYVFDVDLFHWHEAGAAHDEAAWAARVARPLGIFAAM